MGKNKKKNIKRKPRELSLVKKEVLKKPTIEETIFRIFLKHIKLKNLYVEFRWSLNYNGRNADIYHAISRLFSRKYFDSVHKISSLGNGFVDCSSINDICKAIKSANGNKIVKKGNTNDFQMYIMNVVNMLLHNCIEHAFINDIHKIEKLGSEIFEDCCRTLIGDSFEDLTVKRPELSLLGELPNELRGRRINLEAMRQLKSWMDEHQGDLYNSNFINNIYTLNDLVYHDNI